VWASRYWASRNWASRYWAPAGLTSAAGYYWSNYWASRYWATDYWAKQEDSSPFEASVTTGLSLATVITLGSITVTTTNDHTANVTSGLSVTAGIGLNATPVLVNTDQFIAAAPLEITVACAIAIAANPVLGFAASAGTGFYWAGRYWAARYWAPRYWQTQVEFEATVTTGLSVATAINIAGSPQQELVASILADLVVDTQVVLEATTELDRQIRRDEGGRSKKRKKHQVEIEGQVYEADSEAEALYMLEKVKEQAEAAAKLALERATKALKKPTRKILQDARKALKPPVVESEELPSEAEQILKQIDDLYKDTLMKVEIAALLRKQEEDEEEAILLMLV
jgi:hypothetical protein